MILDSDDTISKNAVKSLFDFFEKHYDEVDLVTYPMINIGLKETKEHFRYEYFDKGTGVYDLNEYPYIAQANINIITKNKDNNNTLFNCEMPFNEDEEYNTRILMEKLKIGYVKEAKYYYIKTNQSSAINNNILIYHYFEKMVKYYLGLVKEYYDKNVPKYIQYLILNNFRWRITGDKLFPYHLKNEKFDEAIKELNELAKSIDSEIIINYSKMHLLHKVFLLKMKGAKFKVDFEEDGSYKIYCDNKLLHESDKIRLVLNRFKINEDKIKIYGYLQTLIYEILDKRPEIYLKYKDSEGKTFKKKIDKIFESNMSYFKSKIKTNKLYAFETEINLNEISKFLFIVDEKGIEINTLVAFSKWCPYNKIIKRYKFERKKDFIVYNIKSNKNPYQFYLLKKNFINKFKYELGNIRRYKNPKVLFLRDLGKKRKKRIWLYTDRVGTIDNGLYQFKNDIKKEDGIDRYYIYDGDENIYLKNIDEEYHKYLIKYGSLKHKILFLRSEKILSSHSTLHEYCPLDDTEFKKYRDLMKYDLIYLQHGILHANLVKLYSKDYTEIEKIIVSSNFEENNFISKYNYDKENIIKVGMPRLQEEAKHKLKNGEAKNKILFAPSWRAYLISEPVNGVRRLKTSMFLKSKYYKEMNEFLNSEKLINLLKENNLELDFQIHPIFREYQKYFKLSDDRIKIVKNTNISDYKILITDFSSFQFDFVALKRPIIYFMPDMEEFKAGLHSYRELDLPYEKAFGKLTMDQEDLINKLEEIINNNCTDDEEYLNREKEFFIDFSNSQEKLYNELIEN